MFSVRAPAASRAPALAFAAAVLIGPAAVAQQAVPALYDGSNTTYTLTPGSNLRVADSLTSKIAFTLWQGGQLKGTGTCSQSSCPVVYDGQNLFARRSRLKLPASMGIVGGGASAGAGATATTITRTLRRGDEGNDVMRLQEALNRAGAALTIDRRYGRGTRAAVESFQRARGLKVDGVAGPATLQALGV